MEHNEWFNERVGTDSVNAAAKTAGLAQATLDGQLKRGSLPAESVIKIARAYDYNPVQGLVDTGYLDALEAQGKIAIINWEDVTDAELCKELLDRCDPDGTLSRETWDGPLDDDAITEIEGAAPTTRTQLRVAPDFSQMAASKHAYGPKDQLDGESGV